jgi:hypothetical protein
MVRVGAQGDLAVDWGQYDAVAGRCLSGRVFFDRVAQRHWLIPFHAVLSADKSEETLESPRYAELVREYLVNCTHHFEERGWLDRAYAMVPGIREPSVESITTTKRLSDIARRVDRRIPIASGLFPQDMAPYGWADFPHEDFSDSIDIWAPRAQFYDVEEMVAQRVAGRRTWMSVDRPPYSGSLAIQARPTSTRVLGWQMAELGVEALLLGRVNSWPAAEANPAPQDCARYNQKVLLYPGGPFGLDEPVPSVRLKRLRRSLQDAAYFQMLEEHNLGHVTATLRRSLAPYAASGAYRTHFADGRPNSWPVDTRLFEDARRIMAERLIAASYARRPGETAASFAQTMAWKEFMDEVRKVRLFADGARVRFFGTPEAPVAEVECTLTIRNEKRSPLSGNIRIVEMPPEWAGSGTERDLPELDPGKSRPITLVTRVNVVPTRPNGRLTLPVELTTQDGTTVGADVRLACVSALPYQGPLSIDGDLSDWPPGTTNVASDFLPITGAVPDSPAGATATARSATTALVMRDDESLYLAVNCEATEPAHPQTTRRKGVRYRDSIPMDEELIEILIDPLNAGTRSPTDLYHIVVKRSGMDQTEKGIALDPPVGRREPWPVDLELATSTAPDRWTAELRIPLSAFAPAPAEHTTWGLNITRYDVSNQEFSTWSGATGNAYDPLSLGNMYLP